MCHIELEYASCRALALLTTDVQTLFRGNPTAPPSQRDLPLDLNSLKGLGFKSKKHTGFIKFFVLILFYALLYHTQLINILN